MKYAPNADVVTPSDTDELPGASTAGLFIGTGGTLTVTLLSGKKISTTVPAGLFPVVATQVWASGTGASNIVSLRL